MSSDVSLTDPVSGSSSGPPSPPSGPSSERSAGSSLLLHALTNVIALGTVGALMYAGKLGPEWGVPALVGIAIPTNSGHLLQAVRAIFGGAR